MYTTLITKYGYQKENIFVHYVDGTFIPIENPRNDLNGDNVYNDDIDYSANKGDILHTFRSMAGIEQDPIIPILSTNDVLFVFTGGHGSYGLYGNSNTNHSYLMLPTPPDPSMGSWDKNSSRLWDTELASVVKDINCGQMIFLITQCSSGGFKDPIMNYNNNPKCKNRTIQVSCSMYESAFDEPYITYDTNFTQFTYYWTAAIRGYFPKFYQTSNGWKIEPWNLGPSVNGSSDPMAINYGFPYNSCFPTCPHPIYNPDRNNDGVVTLDEAFHYADDYDCNSQCLGSSTDFYCPWGYNPTDFETPDSAKNICFHEDLQSLTGLTGEITINRTLDNRSYIVCGPLSVTNNVNLTFPSLDPNTQTPKVYFQSENATLTVYQGSALTPGSGMLFEGDPLSAITIYGSINPVSNATFNNVRFTNWKANDIAINNSNFNNCIGIESFTGNITVTNSHFLDTRLLLRNDGQNPGYSAKVAGCTFLNANNDKNGIELSHYKNFNIGAYNSYTGNNVNGFFKGISLEYSGGGSSGNQFVRNNIVSNASFIGLDIYNSTASVILNHLADNYIGAEFMNNSNLQLLGSPEATTISATQGIRDNQSFEIYSTDNSFPTYFRYNAIIDEDNQGNPSDPLIYNDNSGLPQSSYEYDVRGNCWGQNFNPEDDLYTYWGIFKWEPTWCPGNNTIPSQDPAEDMYSTAMNHFDSANYLAAKPVFQLLINQYPESRFSQAAMSDLFRLEQFAGNNYLGLKEYYLTNDSIVTNSILKEIGEFLANKCDILLDNWQQAISWYENRIENPPSPVDSICAIIDLEDLYLVVENQGQKATYVGRLPQYRPKSILQD
ncbi:MAG: hypothetical protein NTX61_16350 [Bacteroidetes bacterium]|nr:hypothetical protein [Bacteroidota bacterium]